MFASGVNFCVRAMKMQAAIQRWCNSQGLRIPKSVLKTAGLTVASCRTGASDGGLTIRNAAPRKHETLAERLEAFYGKPVKEIGCIDSDPEADWGPSVAIKCGDAACLALQMIFTREMFCTWISVRRPRADEPEAGRCGKQRNVQQNACPRDGLSYREYRQVPSTACPTG